MKCVVVIPIYKESLKGLELKSFRQGLKIFSKHDVVIVTHKDLNLKIYDEISTELNKPFKIKYFEKYYFESIQGYNHLMLSKGFYHSFESYIYMLIYQLDAYVFKDDLDYWCNQRYDYIGAPMFKTKDFIDFSYDFKGVGNGGFSLRKISFCLKLLSYPHYFPFLTFRGLLNNSTKLIHKLSIPLKILGIRNNLHFYLSSGKINEDCIFSIWAKESWINIKLPSPQEALEFSFEMYPSYLYKLNKNALPFGCHAFEKYEYNSFWFKYIKE